MHTGEFLHPEIKKDVIKEFHRLRKRHPSLDSEALMAMSRDFVWTLALADSSILRCELSLETL